MKSKKKAALMLAVLGLGSYTPMTDNILAGGYLMA